MRKKFDDFWERRVVLSADVLIFPTREIQAMYESTYGVDDVRKKSSVLPHHFMPALYNESKKMGSTDDGKVSFTYFGDFYGARSPLPFIHALHKIASESPGTLAKIRAGFTGNIESRFRDLVDAAPLQISRNKVTYLESLQEMTRTDVLVLIDAPSEDGVNPFLPSKLVDYLGAGKPILGITDLKGSTADILRGYGHVVVSPRDVDGIACCIRQWVDSARPLASPPQQYTTANVMAALGEKFTDLLMERPMDSTTKRV